MKLNGLEKQFKTNKIDEIIDLKQVDEYGYTPLIYAIMYNKSQNLNLSSEQLDYLIKNSDLKHIHKYSNQSPLMYALKFNKEEVLNLSHEQLDYLIKKSDLKQRNVDGGSTMMIALSYNQLENLTKEQWKYLIDNSDCSLIQDKEQLIELIKIQ